MTLYEERILYELARYNLPRKITDIAKACRLSPKTTRQAVHSLTEKGFLTANHAIRNPLPWRLPPEIHSQRLPAKTFMAAAEIHKHPELNHTEIAQRAQTSKNTAIRAERILQALTHKSRLKRAEQQHKQIHTNNRTLAQRRIQERQEQEQERQRLAERERRIAQREQILKRPEIIQNRIQSLKEEVLRPNSPTRQSQIFIEIRQLKTELRHANFEALISAEREF